MDIPGYGALHAYLRAHYPKSSVCDECGKPADRTEYALIKGHEYTRSREDYRELCKACHNRYDEVGGSRWRDVMTAWKSVQTESEPPCKCGCTEPAGWDAKHARWRKYAPGHYDGRARVQHLRPWG